jgi:HKD family nuclease
MTDHSPREFCQESGYRSTLLLTWSFDALFFERLVHHDLRQGGSGTQLVIADRKQVEAVSPSWSGRLQRLGRSFVLETANVTGNFHPKVILRLGEQGGAIWIGSGNITPGGWGKQREIASQWKFGPDQEDHGAWVSAFLAQIKGWCTSSQSLSAISRMSDEAWIARTVTAESLDSPLIMSEGDLTLAAQLEARWRGRKFEAVHILTGSTDKTGEFLRWAHETFGIERAVVCVAPSRSIFDARKLEALPLEVVFVAPSETETLHAKYYWFEAGPESAAVVGSPNCSYSAWLRPPNKGGNVECALVYDAPVRTDFESVMTDFTGETKSPAEHLLPPRPDNESLRTSPPPYVLVLAELDTGAGTIRVQISPEPDDAAEVEARLGSEIIPLKQLSRGLTGGFTGLIPESSRLPGTLFATARVTHGSQSFMTRSRWVDQISDLRAASSDPRLTSLFQRFRTAQTSTEQNKLSRDVHIVMDVIFGDKAGFPDLPVGQTRSATVTADENEARYLDPKDLIAELRATREEGNPLAAVSQGFTSLHGVIQALFPDEDEDTHYEEEVDETNISSNWQSANRTSEPLQRGPEPSEKLKKRLAKQMEQFLQKLQSPGFARTCTAPQMVQAAAFPLAMAVLGQESSWTDAETARRWVLETATTLFHRPLTPGTEGLLESVRARYASEGEEEEEEYQQSVGDGLLWATLGTVLLRIVTNSAGASVERALMLREVLQRNGLVSPQAIEKLGLLAKRVHHRRAFDDLIKEMPFVVEQLGELECLLHERSRFLIAEQDGAGQSHLPGDPLWHESAGWVFANEEVAIHRSHKLTIRAWLPSQFTGPTPVVGAGGYYINLRVAAARHPDLEQFRMLHTGVTA